MLKKRRELVNKMLGGLNSFSPVTDNEDTDGDTITDGDEILLGLNPLLADTDKDGIADNEEKIE